MKNYLGASEVRIASESTQSSEQRRIQKCCSWGVGAEMKKVPINRERSERKKSLLIFIGTSLSRVFKRNYVTVSQCFCVEIWFYKRFKRLSAMIREKPERGSCNATSDTRSVALVLVYEN